MPSERPTSDASLFAAAEADAVARHAPLASRMRARNLDEFVGQRHFLGEGKLLRRLLDADRLASAIFFGPPGTGKTTLATLIAHRTASRFVPLNATAASVKQVREAVDTARARRLNEDRGTVLFIDEIHRFNRAQQDVLLPGVEDGSVILLGATTENPFFTVNSPLISRSHIFAFEPLSEEEIATLLHRALADEDRGLGTYRATIDDEAVAFLAVRSDGDARRALNALEVAVRSQAAAEESSDAAPAADDGPRITLAVAEDSLQRKAIVHDGTGDQHYDLASAFIKSMRASEPDATIYWLARMLEAGEDPRFIARRIAILASEDIGLADPNAMTIAASAITIVTTIGLPEAELTLAEAALYMATAPKSPAASRAIWGARADVKAGRTIAVPPDLRDGHYAGAKRLGHGQNYIDPHKDRHHHLKVDYLPTDTQYYSPTSIGREKAIAEWLAARRAAQRDAKPASEKKPRTDGGSKA